MLTTVELFAGIGGFRLAADKAGFKTLWANDIDPLASLIYTANFGTDCFHKGDVRELLTEIPHHNILTGGFPCQPFSSAGKKQGIRDPRGTLFQVIVDTLKKHSPDYFVLENVKRLLTMENGSHFATILYSLSELDYRLEWRLLNAWDFGLPQNRQRVFITGVHKRKALAFKPTQTFLSSTADFSPVDPSFYWGLSDSEHWSHIANHQRAFPFWGQAIDGRFFSGDPNIFSESKPRVCLSHILESEVDSSFDFTEKTLEWIDKNTVVNRFVDGVEILSNQKGGARMGYTIFGINGVAPTLTSTASRHYERYKIGDRYRRLTNVEYARIQGFPETHCNATSVYNQYALFGNAVPPQMAFWVLNSLINTSVKTIEEPRSLFSGAISAQQGTFEALGSG